MVTVDSVILKHVRLSEKGICVEYGSDSTPKYEDHLYQFEENNWIVLCIQPDSSIFSSVRTHRRLVLNEKCGSVDSIDSKRLDTVLSKTNINKVDLLLLKRDHDFYSILKGFDPIRWNTSTIVVEIPDGDERIGNHLGNLGFGFIERIHNYFIFKKDPVFIRGEMESVKKDTLDHIFSV